MPFFIGYAFGLLRAKGFFLFLRLGPRNQPGLSGREGAFCPIPAKYPSMFHVELFLSSVLPLARSRPKAFFFSSGSAKKPARPVQRGRGLLSNSCKAPSNVPRGTFSFFGIAFGLLQAKGFFLFIRLGPRNQPGLSGREGAFCPISCKAPFNVPHGTFFTFQNAKKPGFVRFACFHPPASVL